MRRAPILAIVFAALMLVPVSTTADITVQATQADDPRQPSANSSTMYLYHDGFAEPWSHFADNDTDSTSEGEYREEKDNGVIDIKLRFLMKPQLATHFLLTEGGEVRGSFRIDVAGDWENGGSGNCNNDCAHLNISVFKGPAEIWNSQFSGVTEGEQTIPFLFTVTEEMLEWNGRDDNPVIEVRMKVKGDRTAGPFPGTVQGNPAHFAIKLGTQSKVEFPIDEASWSEEFQSGDNTMTSEDTPGFTLVAGSVAMGMAVFVNQRKRIKADQ